MSDRDDAIRAYYNILGVIENASQYEYTGGPILYNFQIVLSAEQLLLEAKRSSALYDAAWTLSSHVGAGRIVPVEFVMWILGIIFRIEREDSPENAKSLLIKRVKALVIKENQDVED